MVIQHLGGSGFDLEGLGIGLHNVFQRFSKKNTPPLDTRDGTRLRNKPCHEPCVRRSVIFTLSGTHGLDTRLRISRVTAHGLDTRLRDKPCHKPCVNHVSQWDTRLGHTARGQAVSPPLMLQHVFNFNFNSVRARYPSCTSE